MGDFASSRTTLDKALILCPSSIRARQARIIRGNVSENGWQVPASAVVVPAVETTYVVAKAVAT